MHHILTGYTVGRIGEGEISAWELGTGSMFRHPILGNYELNRTVYRAFLTPKRMIQAYRRGLISGQYLRFSNTAVDRSAWRIVYL